MPWAVSQVLATFLLGTKIQIINPSNITFPNKSTFIGKQDLTKTDTQHFQVFMAPCSHEKLYIWTLYMSKLGLKSYKCYYDEWLFRYQLIFQAYIQYLTDNKHWLFLRFHLTWISPV